MPALDILPNLTGHLVDEGRLRLLEVLGAGAFGVVYKALDTTSPSHAPSYYAVKCLGSGTRYDKLEIELHTVCSPHPSVLAIHRQFWAEGYLCIVLELAACDLWALIDDGEFRNNNARVKKAFLQVLDAVRFCHDRGVYHRDLKPENILCCPDASSIRVADFGVAIDDELPSTSAGGSISYMTPESLSLGHGTETYEPAQSDVWACCIILLNMMSGGFPWRKATGSDGGWAAFLKDERYLHRKFPISDPLGKLLTQCFCPAPAARPDLIQLRFQIANMKELFRAPSDLLAIPLNLGLSAPSTPGASFSFHVSDYPSPSSTSAATSISVSLHPVRASDMGASPCDECGPARAYDSRPFADRVPAPAADSADPSEISPEVQDVLARIRVLLAALPRPSIDREPPAPPPPPPPISKTASHNPLRRFCRWIKKARRAYSRAASFHIPPALSSTKTRKSPKNIDITKDTLELASVGRKGRRKQEAGLQDHLLDRMMHGLHVFGSIAYPCGGSVVRSYETVRVMSSIGSNTSIGASESFGTSATKILAPVADKGPFELLKAQRAALVEEASDQIDNLSAQ
ncbi:kinase-like domain-containing protein [Mycena pura]|uniref:Kinase-like domain-containing protein n=1 Tax=Mycena pura TaxID=153505 RepID=A0AAD6VAB0_9AGAR|nr:kinase-like domain-containing protein [Mycena pura]